MKYRLDLRVVVGGRHIRAAAAFTLIELMVVIVIIGIVTAAILPAMRGTYGDAVLRSTGRELINVFELAYSRAVSLNQPHRVNIDERTGRYVLEAERHGEGENGFIPVRDVPGSEGALDSRIAVSVHLGSDAPGEENAGSVPVLPMAEAAPGSEAPGITFYPDGTADGGAIRLQDRDGFRLELRINPVTARVRILEVARE